MNPQLEAKKQQQRRKSNPRLYLKSHDQVLLFDNPLPLFCTEKFAEALKMDGRLSNGVYEIAVIGLEVLDGQCNLMLGRVEPEEKTNAN